MLQECITLTQDSSFSLETASKADLNSFLIGFVSGNGAWKGCIDAPSPKRGGAYAPNAGERTLRNSHMHLIRYGGARAALTLTAHVDVVHVLNTASGVPDQLDVIHVPKHPLAEHLADSATHATSQIQSRVRSSHQSLTTYSSN